MKEFTGERVIPGQVNDDLWAEHIARYAFAARSCAAAPDARARCRLRHRLRRRGAGAHCRVGYRRRHRIRGNRLCARAREPPEHRLSSSFRDGAALLCRRLRSRSPRSKSSNIWPTGATYSAKRGACLHPGGSFWSRRPTDCITPNRAPTTDRIRFTFTNSNSRNFEAALGEYFPHVAILFQNRVEAFAFHDHTQSPRRRGCASTWLHANRRTRNSSSRVCSSRGHRPTSTRFVYVPRASNLLREREQHIHLLERGTALSPRQWLDAKHVGARSELHRSA